MYNLVSKKNNEKKNQEMKKSSAYNLTYRRFVDHNQSTDHFRDSSRYVPCRSGWSRRLCNNSRAPGRADRKLRCRGTRTACKRSLSSFSSPSPSHIRRRLSHPGLDAPIPRATIFSGDPPLFISYLGALLSSPVFQTARRISLPTTHYRYNNHAVNRI